MAGQRKIPERMCVGCHQVCAKKDLIRIVRSPEGVFSLDRTGKKLGRGAYLCNKAECLAAAIKNHGLEKSFKTAIGQDMYAQLQQDFMAEDK